jgi:hypothetical protein
MDLLRRSGLPFAAMLSDVYALSLSRMVQGWRCEGGSETAEARS